MSILTGDGISLADLEKILLGNADDVSIQYDPAENGIICRDEDTGDELLTVREDGEVVIPVKANVGEVDADKLISNLSANGYDITGVDDVSSNSVTTDTVSGGVTDSQGDITRLPGSGLGVDNGDLAVTASFSGISGISNPLTADLNADQFDINNIRQANAESLNAKETTTADTYRTAVSDTDLSDTISASNAGDTIKIKNVNLSDTYSISKPLTIIGSHYNKGTEFTSNVTLSDRVLLKNAGIVGATLTIDARFCRFQDSQGGSGPAVQINADDAMLSNLVGYDVTFASGTSNGLVDSSNRITITDNGSNTIGDIA